MITFWILLIISMSIHTYLCEKIMMEIELMEDIQEINRQIQHERKIIEEVSCLIQCNTDDQMTIIVDNEEVYVQFYDGFCVVSDSMVKMMIEVDKEENVLRNVTIEK